MKSGDLINLGICGIGVCLTGFCWGCSTGKSKGYEAVHTRYKPEITSLQNQVQQDSQMYTSEITSLQEKQAAEILALQKKQTAAVDAQRKRNDREITAIKTGHEKELIEARDSSYLKGQVDARDNAQNKIEDRVRKNMAAGDWNAPVAGIKK